MVVGPRRTYEGRTTMFVVLACIVAASGGLIFGYDIGISGNVSMATPSRLILVCVPGESAACMYAHV